MKKKICIITALLLLAVVLTAGLAGCGKKLTVEDVYNIASYSVGANEGARTVEIEVKSGDTVVYTYKDGKNSDPFDIGFTQASFAAAGSGLKFAAGAFANEALSSDNVTGTYTADIVDVEGFLNDPDAKDAKVSVTVAVDSMSVKTMSVSYNTAKNGTPYAVVIAVTAA